MDEEDARCSFLGVMCERTSGGLGARRCSMAVTAHQGFGLGNGGGGGARRNHGGNWGLERRGKKIKNGILQKKKRISDPKNVLAPARICHGQGASTRLCELGAAASLEAPRSVFLKHAVGEVERVGSR